MKKWVRIGRPTNRPFLAGWDGFFSPCQPAGRGGLASQLGGVGAGWRWPANQPFFFNFKKINKYFFLFFKYFLSFFMNLGGSTCFRLTNPPFSCFFLGLDGPAAFGPRFQKTYWPALTSIDPSQEQSNHALYNTEERETSEPRGPRSCAD